MLFLAGLFWLRRRQEALRKAGTRVVHCASDERMRRLLARIRPGALVYVPTLWAVNGGVNLAAFSTEKLRTLVHPVRRRSESM